MSNARSCRLQVAILTASFALLFSSAVQGQILIEEATAPAPKPAKAKVGESAARKYFVARQNDNENRKPDSDLVSGPRHLNIYFGTFLSDKQYRWGALDKAEDVGELIAGVSYRVGEWVNSMDLYFRSEFTTFDVDGEKPVKLSLMPVVAFPDAVSGFPFYFGAGLGLGIFFSQVKNESDLSFDYQILAGFRRADLFDSFGLSFEVGYKGQVLLLSSGQFAGTYFTVGTVHEF